MSGGTGSQQQVPETFVADSNDGFMTANTTTLKDQVMVWNTAFNKSQF